MSRKKGPRSGGPRARRSFSPGQKLELLAGYEQAVAAGEGGAFLRREGLYSSLMGDIPYAAIKLAMVEDDLPGGHAPGYFAMLNNPPPVQQFNWRNDPAAFANFPEFFIAHELAHEWFGQAVGWKNYHEQWLIEGFAQYFAALYSEHLHRKDSFDKVISQMARWTLDKSDQGSVYLGYRLGHIKGDSRVFRALVYNKGGLVLHMLRRLIGDEAFFNGVKRFYMTWRFKKAGTEDLKAAFEAEAHRSQERNRQDAVERLVEILKKAAEPPPPPRKKTRPTKASKERRLTAKKTRGVIKSGRGKVDFD